MAKRKLSAKQKHLQKIKQARQAETRLKEQQKQQAKSEKKERQRAEKAADRIKAEAQQGVSRGTKQTQPKVTRETKQTAKEKKQAQSKQRKEQRKQKQRAKKEQQKARAKARKQRKQDSTKDESLPNETELVIQGMLNAIDDHTQGEVHMAQTLLEILEDARSSIGDNAVAKNVKESDEEAISFIQVTLKYKLDSDNGQNRVDAFFKMVNSRIMTAYESIAYKEEAMYDEYVNDPENYGDDFGYASTADID